MNFNKKLFIIILGLIIVIFIKSSSFNSKFGNIADILDDNYSSKNDLQYNCKNMDARIIPSGHLPGSTILLTPSEKQELLLRFIENGPELI